MTTRNCCCEYTCIMKSIYERVYKKKNRIFVETFDKTKRFLSDALIRERRSLVDFQFIHFFIKIM